MRSAVAALLAAGSWLCLSAQGDFFLTLRPKLRARSNWSRHAINSLYISSVTSPLTSQRKISLPSALRSTGLTTYPVGPVSQVYRNNTEFGGSFDMKYPVTLGIVTGCDEKVFSHY
jgi:hypothetical protein